MGKAQYPTCNAEHYTLRKKWQQKLNPWFYNAISTINHPILDVGAGSAKRHEQFKNKLYLTLDINHENFPDIVGDAHYLPIKNNVFQTVLCLSLLEHVLTPNQVLKDISRILKKGGKLVVTVPFFYHLHDFPHDYFRCTEEGISKLLEMHSFKIIEKHRFSPRLFSTLTSFLVTWTIKKRTIFRRLIQWISQLILPITKQFDIGKNRIYTGSFIICIKKS